jgi:hypothetical protein
MVSVSSFRHYTRRSGVGPLLNANCGKVGSFIAHQADEVISGFANLGAIMFDTIGSTYLRFRLLMVILLISLLPRR